VGVGGSGCFWSSATTSSSAIGGWQRGRLLTKGRLDELDTSRLPRQLQSQPFEVRLDGSRVLKQDLEAAGRQQRVSRSDRSPSARPRDAWAADRVVYDFAIAEDEPASDGQIAVRLVRHARDVLDGVMKRLTAAGIDVDLVGTDRGPD